MPIYRSSTHPFTFNRSLCALVGALTLSAVFACSAGATVKLDKSFGVGGSRYLKYDARSNPFMWDHGTVLRDGSVAFLSSTTRKSTRIPTLRIVGPTGKIDRKFDSNYRIPYSRAARHVFAHTYGPWAVERQADGKLVLAGGARIPVSGGSSEFRTGWIVQRLTRLGKLDTSFGKDGFAPLEDKGKSADRFAFSLFGPDSLTIDRTGAIFVYGPSASKQSGSRLIRLTRNGSLDRRFGTVVEEAGAIDPDINNSKLQLGVTDAGQLVTVGLQIRPTAEGRFQDYAVIHRYTAAGRLVKTNGATSGTAKVLLPGLGEACTYDCYGIPFQDSIDAKVLPSGAVLISGEAGESGSSVTRHLTMVRSDGNLDTSFGANGYAEISLPARASGTILTFSVRKNGQIWTVMSTSSEQYARSIQLVRLDSKGGVIRMSDGSLGESIPDDSKCEWVDFYKILGTKLIDHTLCGAASATNSVVRRWSLKY